jgi:glycosyltransferase involved in cell wall biosynthesis
MSEPSAPRRPIRLLWLLDSLHVGGAEALALSFAQNHDRDRIELIVAHLRTIDETSLEGQFEKTGVRIVNLRARNLRDVAAFRRLLRFVREEKIELIHAHLVYAILWAAVISRITRVPSVATLHTAPPAARSKYGLLDRIMAMAVNRWSKLVVMVSEAQRQNYIRSGAIEPGKLRTVHNGIDLQRFMRDAEDARFRLERELGIPALSPIVITVSVLREVKGIDILLEAARLVAERVPSVRFVIVGDGPKGNDWKQLAENLRVSDRVHWLGHRDDVDAMLAGCDVFVLPSRADALPTVLMEAMAAGLPVVATDVGGVSEIVEAEKTGRLVPAADPAQLATAIADLLRDRATLERMSAAAPASVAHRFSTVAWIERLERVYEEAVA